MIRCAGFFLRASPDNTSMSGEWIWIATWTAAAGAAAVGAAVVAWRDPGHPRRAWTLAAVAVTVLLGGAWLIRFRGDASALWLTAHVTTALALLWAGAMALLAWADPRGRAAREISAGLGLVALLCGVIAAVLLAYWAAFEIVLRFVEFGRWSGRRSTIPAAGLLDLAGLWAACLLARRANREASLVTVLFWLSGFAVIWAGLLHDPARSVPAGASGAVRIVYTDGPIFVLLGAAVVTAVFVGLRRAGEIRRRRRAWPDRLADLTTPAPAWPGFRLSVGVVGALVLAVGCVTVARPETIVATGLAGVALLLLTAETYSINLAETAAALISVCVVGAFVGAVRLVAAVLDVPVSSDVQTLEDFPEILRRMLFGLAAMTWFWHWLANVWVQQLDDGRAWTTAGRMIPVGRHVGYMAASVGVLIGLYMAAWPGLGLSVDPDDGRWAWCVGLLGLGSLTLATAGAALRTRRSTLGWMSVLSVLAVITFVHFRSEGSLWHAQATRHGPLLLAGAAIVTGLAPRAIRLSSGNPYREILHLTGIVLLPMLAMILILVMEDSELAGRWIIWAALGVLAVWYVALSRVPQLRELLWIGLALANLGGLAAWRQHGVPAGLLAGAIGGQVLLSGLILTGTYWRDLGSSGPRTLAAAASVMAGLAAALAAAVAAGQSAIGP